MVTSTAASSASPALQIRLDYRTQTQIVKYKATHAGEKPVWLRIAASVSCDVCALVGAVLAAWGYDLAPQFEFEMNELQLTSSAAAGTACALSQFFPQKGPRAHRYVPSDLRCSSQV